MVKAKLLARVWEAVRTGSHFSISNRPRKLSSNGIGRAFRLENPWPSSSVLRPSLGEYQGERVRAKIWFSPDVAGYIREKIWHESQKITPQDDDSIIFEAEVAGTDEIRVEAEAMAKQYEKGVEWGTSIKL